jgi:hypothetical protein
MRHDSQPFSFTLQAALVTESSDSYANQGRKFIAQRGRQYLENHIAPPCKIALGGYLKQYTIIFTTSTSTLLSTSPIVFAESTFPEFCLH